MVNSIALGIIELAIFGLDMLWGEFLAIEFPGALIEGGHIVWIDLGRPRYAL